MPTSADLRGHATRRTLPITHHPLPTIPHRQPTQNRAKKDYARGLYAILSPLFLKPSCKASDNGDQFRRFNRFGEMGLKTGLNRSNAILRSGKSSQRYCRRLVTETSTTADEFVSILFRHSDIADDDIRV